MYRYPVFFPSVKEREKNARKFEEQEKQKESIIKEEVKSIEDVRKHHQKVSAKFFVNNKSG